MNQSDLENLGNHLTNYTKCLWLQKKPFKLNMIFMFCINTKRNKSDPPTIARCQMGSSVVRFQAELHRDYAEGGAGGGALVPPHFFEKIKIN